MCGLSALVVSLGVLGILSRGLFATTPAECWADVAAGEAVDVEFVPESVAPDGA
jgi:hypothetical protein